MLVPRLIVACGTRRERYDSAFQMQCYSGIAPVKEASGKTEWIHFRLACPKFLGQAFHELASRSIGQSEMRQSLRRRGSLLDVVLPATPLAGKGLPVSQNFLKITLDGLTQIGRLPNCFHPRSLLWGGRSI